MIKYKGALRKRRKLTGLDPNKRDIAEIVTLYATVSEVAEQLGFDPDNIQDDLRKHPHLQTNQMLLEMIKRHVTGTKISIPDKPELNKTQKTHLDLYRYVQAKIASGEVSSDTQALTQIQKDDQLRRQLGVVMTRNSLRVAYKKGEKLAKSFRSGDGSNSE